MDVSLRSVADQDVFDVVVIGAGCAGMSAALCAAIDGARVLLVERTEYLGGTTALSAATSWVPLSKPGLAVDPSDSYEKALDFLDRGESPAGVPFFLRTGKRLPARTSAISIQLKEVRIVPDEEHEIVERGALLAPQHRIGEEDEQQRRHGQHEQQPEDVAVVQGAVEGGGAVWRHGPAVRLGHPDVPRKLPRLACGERVGVRGT